MMLSMREVQESDNRRLEAGAIDDYIASVQEAEAADRAEYDAWLDSQESEADDVDIFMRAIARADAIAAEPAMRRLRNVLDWCTVFECLGVPVTYDEALA